MHFYRRLRPVKAMTFDLDDTLYDNHPVIGKSVAASHAFMQSYHPALRDFSHDDYQQLRDRLLEQEPDLYHDVTQWRWRTTELAMRNAGLTVAQAKTGANQVMDVFSHWRSQIDVPEETHATLAFLASRLPLAAISNGNAQPERFGLDRYFCCMLRAGPDGRAKPWPDMYQRVAQQLGIEREAILHVGDNLLTDVAGAVQGGLQACWLNLHAENLMQLTDARLLPDVEITRLASLTTLI